MALSAPRRAFTLIELLVVLALVALLLGILLPVLVRAREAARGARCLSNQRQIGIALALYAEQFREYTPRESGFCEVPFTPPARWAPAWAYVLRPMLDPGLAFVSPRVDQDGGVGDRFAGLEVYRDPSRRRDRHNIHYVVNGLSFHEPEWVNSFAKPPTPMARYRNPCLTLYLSCFTDDPTEVHANWVNQPGFTDWRVAAHYDLHHVQNLTGTMPTSFTHSQRIAPRRHGDGANGLYLDGHARRLPRAELTDLAAWDDGDYRADVPWVPPP